jgi:hypothetical protein
LAQTPVLDLPVPPATVGAAGVILNPDGNSYVGVTLSSVPAGQDIVTGTYDAWCIDFFGALNTGNFSTYNSYGGVLGNPNPPLPLNVLQNGQTAWNEVNWLINHKTGNGNDEPGATPAEVQDAIWTLLDPFYPAAFNDAVSNVLVLDAQNFGAGFVAGPGQFVAVLLYADGIQGQTSPKNIQDLIIQVRVGGTIGDYVWLDQNHNGLQEPNEAGINGVTVDLYQGNALVATTVTTNAPAGYSYSGPNPAGYYQFAGLPPGSYTVVIPNNQPALSGTGPTLPFQGSNVLIDSNGQESTIPGTTTPAVTAPVTLPSNNQAPNSLVDETIDFGFYPVQPITLTCPTGTAQVGVAYSSMLVASGGQAPYTFSISAGSLPPGLTLNPTTGAITGTPTTAGAFSFTAKVVDSSGQSAGTTTTNCTITVTPPPITLTCPVGTAMVGVFYNSALVASGGQAPYTFSIVSGSLPTGLTLNPNAGAIAGTPSAAGTFSFTAKVVDSSGQAAGTTTTSCTITVNPANLTLACPASSAQVGVPYNSALTTTGGQAPFTFSITAGSLPPGLLLNPSTGVISGTPTSAGPFSVTAKVVDSSGLAAGTTTTNCTITVAPPPIKLMCPSGTALVGVPYSSGLVATGGVAPYTYSIIGGSLPPGLTLNPANGVISGTPTLAGSYSFTAQVVDSSGLTTGVTTSQCTIVVNPRPISLMCGSGTAQVGVAFGSALFATGGVPPYTFSIVAGSLPSGLTLNPSTGAITGVPTVAGTFSFTAKVVDSSGSTAGTATTNCTITVIPPPITLACPTSTAQVGTPYSSALTTTGGLPPFAFSIVSGSLPPGLTLNASTGAITGTPTAAGTFSFTAKVVDSSGLATGTTTTNCTITVKAQCLLATLGSASTFSVLELQAGHVEFSSGGTRVNGNVGIAAGSQFVFSGGGLVQGKLFVDPSVNINLSGGSQITGGEVMQSMTGIQNAALAEAAVAGSLSPTQSFGQIQSSTNITGNGGQNVIQVSQVNLNGGATLTISGGANDTFIIRMSGNFQLQGGSRITLNGVSANQVLFYFPNSGSHVQTGGNSNTQGIFLLPQGSIDISGGSHVSEFIAGNGITLHSAPVVNAFPACPSR